MISQHINSQQIIRKPPWRLGDSIVFIIGLFSLYYVNVIGQLYISEILLTLLTPILWLRRGRSLLKNPDARKIMSFGALWFIGQVLTDILRQTPVFDLARGWSGIIVLLFSFSSLYLLMGNNIRRIKIFACGYAISGILSFLIQASPYFSSSPWKFGFGGPAVLLTFLFVIMVSRGELIRMRKWLWLIIGVGGLSFFLDARSLGGIVILSGLVLLLRTSSFTRWILVRFRIRNLFAAGLVLAGLLWGLLEGYAYSAKQGLLGPAAQYKFESQYNGNVWGLLLGGRIEILASSQAILDSPIIGHGSWAKDAKYRHFIYQLAQLGYQVNMSQLDSYINSTDLIPAHSHFTQAWVWAGLLGALFWGWILFFAGKVFFKVNTTPNELYPLIIYFGFASAWDILFSPFGSLMRLMWALRFVVFLTIQAQVEK
jgi:hypothetical protein